jgi:hypothetical protein
MKDRVGYLFILSAFAPILVQAQNILICKDAVGRTHTSDRPIPECADRAIREMDKTGYVRREIPAPLTAEQKQQKQFEEEKRKAEKAAAEEQRQSDRALLARYRHENDVEVARARTVDPIADQLKREKAVLASAEKNQKAVQLEVGQAPDKNKLPPAAQRKLGDADQAVESTKKRIREYETEIAQINARFDAALKRYRELNAATASVMPPAVR